MKEVRINGAKDFKKEGGKTGSHARRSLGKKRARVSGGASPAKILEIKQKEHQSII